MLYSLQETDVIQEKKNDDEDVNIRKMQVENRKKMINNGVGALKWIFGWCPRSKLKTIDRLNDFAPEYEESEDDD